MSLKSFLSNKYSFSAIILLGLIGLDVILHKGITRVIIPTGFTEARQPFHLPRCENAMISSNKDWVKAINNPQLISYLPKETPGIEIDVYFDIENNVFYSYHDSSQMSGITLDSILKIKKDILPNASVWLDYKNLDSLNFAPSLQYINQLRSNFNLNNKIIIESSNAKSLQNFCDAGYFTSYYVPFHNPYKGEEKQTISFIDSVAGMIKAYPASALSGYYFQYPLLKKFFPNYPLLIWADKSTLSAIGYMFKYQVEKDNSVRVFLTPAE